MHACILEGNGEGGKGACILVIAEVALGNHRVWPAHHLPSRGV